MEKKDIHAQEYFDYVKSKKQEITREDLKKCLDNMTALAHKYEATGQRASMIRLRFLTEVLLKEEKLFDLGLTKFIYRDDLERYIDEVSQNPVKVIELENYLREIPDEIVKTVERVKGIFDQLYIIYTDYTGKEEKRVEESRKSKDPILFGCFKEDNTRGEILVADRFYILGDWEDEYCDLTMDKMIMEMGEDPTKEDGIPQTPEDLLAVLKQYTEKFPSPEDELARFRINPERQPNSIFQKVKSWIKTKVTNEKKR